MDNLYGSDMSADEFAHTESQKQYTTKNIAVSMLSGDSDMHAGKATDLFNCARKVTVTRSGRVIHHARCKSKICLLCATKRREKNRAIMAEAMNHLPFSMVEDPDHDPTLTPTIGIKLTLNAGERIATPQLRETIELLHRLWVKLRDVKFIRGLVIGHHRTTEVTIDASADGELTTNPHLHGLLWIDVTDVEDVPRFALDLCHQLRSRWLKLIKDHTKTSASAAAQQVKPLTQQTLHDAGSWLHYSLKGIIPEAAKVTGNVAEIASPATINMWLMLDQALKGLRLVSCSANVSAAKQDAKAVLDLQLKSTADFEEVKSTKVTHRWSDALQKWVTVDEWTHAHEDPNLIMTLISHLTQPRHLFRVWRERTERHRLMIEEIRQRKLDHFAKTGQVLKDVDILYDRRELILYNLKDVNGNDDE